MATVMQAYDIMVKTLVRKIRHSYKAKTLASATLEDKLKLMGVGRRYAEQLRNLRLAVFDIEDGVITIDEVLKQ